MARRKKNATEAWLERWNPLHGLSIREAQGIFDAACGGDTQRLHWIYQEIESANPVLLVCVERRSSAIANFRWKVSEQAAKNGALSAEQKDAAETLLNGIENFTDALEHLDLAFFRGFAHAQPVWEPDGTVREISLLDSWKFVRKDREWFYNPVCTGFGPDMESTDGCRLMTVTRRRAVDYPALAVHIREAVGERDWGRFLERYALPKPAVTMPQGTTEAQRGDFVEAAERVENGQTSVWPAGTTLSDFAGNSRGTDPFSAFVEHQDKKIVLMATGGTLASLAEAGAGTLAGNAQADVWRSIVARDSSVIAQAVQRSLVLPFIQAKFPGQPCAVNFDFDFDEPPTAKEVFEIAVAAKNAGWKIAKEQLEEQSGYTLEEDTAQNPSNPYANGVQNAPPFMNKRVDGQGAEARKTPLNSVEKTDGGDVLSAFAKDTGPAADAIRELLADPTPEKAKALLDRLPELLPADPALAAVIAEEMAKEFGSVASGSPDALANKTDANGNEHGEDNGQFVSKGGGASTLKSSPRAEEQSIALGYQSLKDMISKSESVDKNRKSEIQEGFFGACKAHEAIAVISENKPFQDAEGNTVSFGKDILQHYVEGKRRKDNEPKLQNLCELPYAIKAVKSDIYGVTRTKYPEGSIPDPLNPPKGTQREYHLDTGHGMMKVFVYIQGGLINGWHIVSRMKKPR